MRFEYFEHIDGPQSYREAGRTILRKGGGGGSSQSYYAELNNLYKKQADQADLMTGVARDTVIPAYQRLMADAESFDSPANREKFAGLALADVNQSISQQSQSLDRSMAAKGVDPSSGLYSMAKTDGALQAIGQQAGAMNNARNYVENMGHARRQDAVSMGMGMPGQASSALASAGNTLSTSAGLKRQQDADSASAVSNGLMGGYAAYKLFAKDGGKITRRGVVRNGLTRRGEVHLAGGGFLQPVHAPSAPMGPSVGNQKSSILPALQVASAGKSAFQGGGMKGLGSAVQSLGDAAGSQTMQSLGQGLSMGSEAGTTAGAMRDAAAVMQGELADAGAGIAEQFAGGQAGEALATQAAGATEAAALSGGAEALTTGAAAMEAGAALSTVMPWVGLAAAAGSMLGLFADGGEVEKRKDMTKGGKVKGPGTETSDSIPARLSDGEYVLNAETVKMIGVPVLDKLNNAGLEKRYGGEQKLASGGAVLSGLGAGLLGISQLERQAGRDKMDQERFGLERARHAREESEFGRKQQMRDDYQATMREIAGVANSAAKIQQGLTSGKLTESDALLQGVEAYNAFTTDPHKMAPSPDGSQVMLYGPDGKVVSRTSAKDALATMLSPAAADHVLMSGYQRLAEKYPEYGDKWQSLFSDVRKSAREERRSELAERRLDQQAEFSRERLGLERAGLGLQLERLELARNADARAQTKLEAGALPKALTVSQQRGNAEIDAAREAVAGLSPEEIRQKTTPTMASGRDNPAFDPRLASAAKLANRRKLGDDPWFDGQRGQPSSFAGKPVEQMTDDELTRLSRAAGGKSQEKLGAEVARRYLAAQPGMAGHKIGPHIEGKGYQVLNEHGQLVSYLRKKLQ